jgi:hypothetical protein
MAEQEDGLMTHPVRNRPSRTAPAPRAKPDPAVPQASAESERKPAEPIDGENGRVPPADGTN